MFVEPQGMAEKAERRRCVLSAAHPRRQNPVAIVSYAVSPSAEMQGVVKLKNWLSLRYWQPILRAVAVGIIGYISLVGRRMLGKFNG
jgi:hypothetical protein